MPYLITYAAVLKYTNEIPMPIYTGVELGNGYTATT